MICRGWELAIAAAIVACAVIATGCHGPVRRPGEEYIAALRFDGNHALSDKDLKSGLQLDRAERRGGGADPYAISVDADRIRGHYARIGYLDAEVHSRVDRAGDAATITFTIREGNRAHVKVSIIGLPTSPADPKLEQAVRDALPLKDGDEFDYEDYDEAKTPLLHAAQDAGYAHAKLDAEVDVETYRAQHLAVIQLTYDLGPLCTFGAVRIEGADNDLEAAVEHRVQFSPGDRYSLRAVADAQTALYAMNRFSTVRITPDLSTGAAVVPVTVSVSIGPVHETRLGAGFGIDPLTYEVRGRAGYSIAGWPTPLSTFTVDTRPAYAYLRDTGGYEPRVRALASVDRMDFLVPFVTGQVAGGYNYLVVEAYTLYGPLARLNLSSPIATKRVNLRVGWRFEYDSFRDFSPILDPGTIHSVGLDQDQRVGAFEQTLSIDLRDNAVETRKGAYLETRVQEGGAFAGGALSFFEVMPDLRVFFPIESTVIAARLKLGGIFGDVPVADRIYGGGASDQRGFSERRMSPTVLGILNATAVSLPIGGAGELETSIEARQLLGHIKGMGVGGVVFVDGGDVTTTFNQLDPSNLNWAAGLGLRLLTIVGAVRADIGFRLNRTGPFDPEPGSRYAFHLSLGEAY